MGVVDIILLGLALSMDAFAVTISNTFLYPNDSKARAALMPLLFGFFQGIMPCIGYLLGQLVSDFVSAYAGIVTFAILGFIGAKMIWDVFHEDEDEQTTVEPHLGLPILILQAIATSIDALAIGVSFAVLSVDVGFAAGVIGITTALCCLIALLIGHRFGQLLGERATIIGGIVLILIGIKSLFL